MPPEIVEEYLAKDRAGARPNEPMFVVTYFALSRKIETRRMLPDRLYKLVKAPGKANGMPQLHTSPMPSAAVAAWSY